MLLTESYYRAITGDTATSAQAFATAASSAQDLLEDALDRVGLLELDERTETLDIDPAGYVYPSATPLVSASDGWQVVDDSLRGGTVDLGSFVALLGSELPTSTEVTYVGGWTSSTAHAYMRTDLAWAAFALLHQADPTALAAIPAGASSASVGDVSISWAASRGSGTPSNPVDLSFWSPETMKHRGVR